jgi:hypothetical protein
MNLNALKQFVAKTIEDAKEQRCIAFGTFESDYDESF